MNALIIVDVQYDFTKGGSLAVPGGEDIIPVINRIQDKFDLVVATQDWHPANHKSFAANHADKQPFDRIELNGLPQVLWPNHCVQGTSGAEFRKELEMRNVEAIFRKGTDPEIDSYSGFYDNGKRKSTGLVGYLKDRKVRHVFVCGLAGDYCVCFTAKDARLAGFETHIITDAVRSISDTDFEAAMKDFTSIGGLLSKSADLVLR